MAGQGRMYNRLIGRLSPGRILPRLPVFEYPKANGRPLLIRGRIDG